MVDTPLWGVLPLNGLKDGLVFGEDSIESSQKLLLEFLVFKK